MSEPRSLASSLRTGMVWVVLLQAAAGASATDACLRTELSAQPAFSGAVLLRQRGNERVAAQGQADATGKALEPDARFNLGSANKMFTAVAVAQLVALGKLALDAPVGRWVEGLKPAVAAVTLRQLLTHSAGLGNFVVPENLAALERARSVEAQMALVTDEQPLFEPGSRFRYSNTGFLLLGRAVERASGQPFAAYLQAHVFAPAGMTQTSLDPSKPSVAATGFTRLPAAGPGAGPPRPDAPLRPAAEATLPGSPAGGAYSTVADMARFFDALESGKLVGAEWVKELTRAHMSVSPPGSPVSLQYGMGFGVITWEGHRAYGHNGGAPGVNVELMRFVQDDVLIVVLANRDPPQAAQLLSSLRRGVLKGNLCA